MAMVLAQFGVILLVVIVGFAASFYSLFRNVDSFDFTLLSLFKTSLGDVGFFDDLDETEREQFAVVGRILLIIFVVSVTIMLLNLLIAILSTAHADIHSNAEREFKVCRARTVQHYRLVVESNILPAPFNVLQLLLSLPFYCTGNQRCESCRYIQQSVGEVAFWAVLSPLALIAGIILWIVSIPNIISIFRSKLRAEPLQVQLVVGFWVILGCILGIPVCLVAVWVIEPFMWIKRGLALLCGKSLSTYVSGVADQLHVDFELQGMLAKAGDETKRSPHYLKNIITDLDIQVDETSESVVSEGTKLSLHELVLSNERKISALQDDMKEALAKIVGVLEKIQRPVASIVE